MNPIASPVPRSLVPNAEETYLVQERRHPDGTVEVLSVEPSGVRPPFDGEKVLHSLPEDIREESPASPWIYEERLLDARRLNPSHRAFLQTAAAAKTRTHGSRADAFANALQLCVMSKLKSSAPPRSNFEVMTLHFAKREKQDDKLEAFHKLGMGEWSPDGMTYHVNATHPDLIQDVTQFLLLTRLDPRNVLKLAELDPKFEKFTAKLGLKSDLSSPQRVHDSRQAAVLLFRTARSRCMTLRRLAESTGLTQTAISNFKAGGDIRLANFIKLAGALRLKITIGGSNP